MKSGWPDWPWRYPYVLKMEKLWMFGLRRLSLPFTVLTNDYLTGSLPVLLGVAC